MHRSSALLLVAFTAAACVRAPAPAPAPSPSPAARPAVPAPAAPAEPTARPLAPPPFAWATGAAHYTLVSDADLEAPDGAREHVQATAEVTVVVLPAADGAPAGTVLAGTIDRYTVAGGARIAAGGQLLAAPVAFAVAIDAARGRALVTSPALPASPAPDAAGTVAPCADTPAAAAVAAVRDLFVVVPAGVDAGGRWRDTTVAAACRGGVPLVVRQAHEYELLESGAAAVRVRRTTALAIEGEHVARDGRRTRVRGEGTQRLELHLDPAAGRLLAGEGTSELALLVLPADAAPGEQRFRQRATHRIAPRAP